MGSSGSYGLRGSFGESHDRATANTASIRRLLDFQDVLTNFVTEFFTVVVMVVLVVMNEMAALNAIQAKMASTQNRNRAIL